MKILVIGGTRFIGAHVARQLVEAGDDVTVLHRGRTANPILPDAVHHIRDESAEYPIVRFPEVLRRDWDAVIHMVAMGEADTRASCEAFAGRAAKFVLISSGDVYRAYGRLTRIEPGPPDPVPLSEDAPLRERLFPYRGKEAAMGTFVHDYEKILAERTLQQSGLAWTILRLPKVYGPEDNADLATIYMAASHPGWRWTHGHVDNVAAAIVLAAKSERAACRIYNVGEELTPTMGERLAHLPPRDPIAPPDFDFAQSMVYDTSRIRSELGFTEIVDERTAMQALIDPQRHAGYTPASFEGQ